MRVCGFGRGAATAETERMELTNIRESELRRALQNRIVNDTVAFLRSEILPQVTDDHGDENGEADKLANKALDNQAKMKSVLRKALAMLAKNPKCRVDKTTGEFVTDSAVERKEAVKLPGAQGFGSGPRCGFRVGVQSWLDLAHGPQRSR